MSFNTASGTRGARPHKPGPVSRRIQGWMSNRIRRKGGKFMGMNVLFLTTTGRRTGKPRVTPVAWFPDGDNAWLIVASAGGSINNPNWYRNIAAHPDQVWVEFPDRKLHVSPEQLEGDRRQECWERVIAAQPRCVKYQQKTDRVIPVIRLVPASDS